MRRMVVSPNLPIEIVTARRDRERPRGSRQVIAPAISPNKNDLLVAEALFLRAAAARDGDLNDWDVSGSVRHPKDHLAN